MPGPGVYWFGKEEMDAAVEVLQIGYLFRFGGDNDPNSMFADANSKNLQFINKNRIL